MTQQTPRHHSFLHHGVLHASCSSYPFLYSYLPSPSVNFTIVFNGTEIIDPARLNGIIVFSKQTEGMTYFTIGDLLVTDTDDVRQYFLMLDMMSTHAYPYTTTPTPGRYELMVASFLTPGRHELLVALFYTPLPAHHHPDTRKA